MSEWNLVKLSEVVEFRNGLNFSEKNDGEGLPIVKVKDFGSNHFVDYLHLDEINPIGLKIGENQLLKKNDIVLVRSNGNKDLVGRAMIYDGPANKVAFAGFCIRGRVDAEKASARFVHYWLRSPGTRERFSREGAGTGIQSVSQALLNAMAISLPPLELQHQLAAILSALDDKIELNRKTAATLDEMARALYRSWFVDFDPVRARAEGREPVHMDAATAALFPDSFGEDGLPAGWSTKRLDEILTLNYGKALRKDQRIAGTFPVYGSGGSDTTHAIPLVATPTIIVGRKGTVGSLRWAPDGCWPIDTVFYVTTSLPMSFILRTLQQLPLTEMNTDAAVPGLNRENVYRLEIPWSGSKVIEAFGQVADILQQRMDVLTVENRTLATLRDSMLPRLMSGELRVSAARELIEEVA